MERKGNRTWVGWMVVVLLPLFTRVAGADNPVPLQINQPDQQIAVETIQGTVRSVGTFRLEGTSIRGLRLRLQTEGGKVVRVNTAPRSYLEHQGIRVQRGDRVTVTGSLAKAGRHNVLVASQLKLGDKTLALRTREGKPLWDLEEPKDSKGSGNPNMLGHSGDLRHAYEW